MSSSSIRNRNRCSRCGRNFERRYDGAKWRNPKPREVEKLTHIYRKAVLWATLLSRVFDPPGLRSTELGQQKKVGPEFQCENLFRSVVERMQRRTYAVRPEKSEDVSTAFDHRSNPVETYSQSQYRQILSHRQRWKGVFYVQLVYEHSSNNVYTNYVCQSGPHINFCRILQGSASAML